MLTIRLSLAVMVALSSWGLSSCLSWTERLCSGDETFVQRTEQGGGAFCQERGASDPACPDGERARLIESTGRTDCVTDEA